MGYSNYDPYAATDRFNVGAYGNSGSQDEASLRNASNQANAAKPGGAPHEAFGNLGDAWASTLSGYMSGRSRAVAPVNPSAPPAGRLQEPTPGGQGALGADTVGGMLNGLPSSKATHTSPAGAWTNPVQKPADPNDLNGMAAYYRGFANDPVNGDPSFANITAADVGNYRMLAIDGKINMSIGDWVKSGKPGGQWTPAAPTNTWTPDQSMPPGRNDRAGNPISQNPNVAGPQYDRNGNPINQTNANTTTNVTASNGSPQGSGVGDIEAALNRLFGPQFARQQQDLRQQMFAGAALTGDINAGTFAPDVYGNAASRLSAQQGAQIGDYLNGDWQAELERAIKNKSIDTQAASSKYSADQGVNAAKYGADAAQAGANASAGASKYNADLDFQLGLQRLGLDNVLSQRNYDLGVLGLNSDVYKSDQNSMFNWANLLWNMSPEARLGNSFNFGNLPGKVGIP